MSPVLEPGQKIAVTGANGFIGAHCVLELLKKGFEIVAIVRNISDPTKTEFLEHEADKLGAKDRLSFQTGDLFKEGSYDEAFLGCDGVLHTAAIVEILDVKDPEGEIVRPSLDGTRNVLNSVKKNISTVKRFVHISSIAAIQSLEKPEDHTFTESDWNTWSTIDSGDAYGYAKTQAEKLVWETAKEELPSSLDVVVLNPAIVLGPCLCKAHTKASVVLVRQVLYGNPMLNYNGSFVDVRDVAAASSAAFTKEEAVGRRFIICGSEPSSTMIINDFVKKEHPWVTGSKPMYSSTTIQLLHGLGQMPIIGHHVGINEFQYAMMTRLIRFDSSRSKDILKISYTSMEDSCRDSADSMKPYVKVENWGESKQ